MKVSIDKDLCSGDGICADICPDVFQMTDEDIAEVIVEEVPKELEDDVREAADTCPESCISIEE